MIGLLKKGGNYLSETEKHDLFLRENGKGHKYSFVVRAYDEVDGGKKIYRELSNGCAFTKNR